MLKVRNFWTFLGAVLFTIIIYNLWKKGQTTQALAGGAENFSLNAIKALEIQ